MWIDGREWKLVPVEPTEDMTAAGYEALMAWDARTGDDMGIEDTYSAMLAAAPTPPAATAAPSDEEIEALALSSGLNKSDEHWGSRYYTELGSSLFRFARALLSRYGQAPSDIEEMVRMLEAGEWAEHAGVSPLGKRLEAVITKLVGQAPAASSETVALDRDTLVDLIADHLSGTYHCTRVWSAWSVGTMSEDDFEDVSESDTPSELADAILARLAAPVDAQAQPKRRPYNASGSLSEYGIFPECDAAQAAASAEPSDEEILRVADEVHQTGWDFDDMPDGLLIAFARALLSRYGQAPAANGDALREAVKIAYGYLWHVNTEPGTPNQYAPERAAYKARIVLREQLTKDERGEGITAVRAAMRKEGRGDE